MVTWRQNPDHEPRSRQGPAPVRDPRNLTERIKARGQDLGFDLVGVTSADPPDHLAAFEEWLDAGYAGTMSYMALWRGKRGDLQRVLPGCKSVIASAVNYYPGDPEGPDDPRAAVGRYAWGRDYHRILKPRLTKLLDFIVTEAGPGTEGKVYVDTGPVLERDLAARAGLGWIGKNTTLLNSRLGSWLFLGVVLVNVELAHDASVPDRCGRCTACLEACPTGAFPAPRVLDATRCISYLTIENREEIPLDLRAQVGALVFGCDVCQEVCPWNRKAPLSREPAFLPDGDLPGLDELARMGEDEFRRRFGGSPFKRAIAPGIRRNAVVALGNRRNPDSVALLAEVLKDSEPLVRRHAAWALGEIGGIGAIQALGAASTAEKDPAVLKEIQAALSFMGARHRGGGSP